MARPRDLAAALALVLLACAACSPASGENIDQATSTSAAAATTTATASVGKDGFHLEVAGVQVEGPAGVADIGTPVTVELLEQDSPDPEITLVAAVDVVIGEHDQPRQPVTISFPLPEPPGETVGYAAFRSDSGKDNYLTVAHEVADGKALVTTDHLSVFSLWGFDPVQWWNDFAEQAALAIGLSYPAPECSGRDAGHAENLADVYFTATGSGLGTVYLCANRPDGGETVDMEFYSNGPVTWEITIDPVPVTYNESVQLRLGDILTTAAYRAVNNYPPNKAIMTPGGQVTLGAATSTLPTRYDGDVSVFWSGAAIGLEAALGAVGGGLAGVTDAAGAATCLADALSVGSEPELRHYLSTSLSCVQQVGGSLGLGPVDLLKLGIVSSLVTGAPQSVIAGLVAVNNNEFTVELRSLRATAPTGYSVPAYCDQPERQAPIGESDVDGKYTWLDGPYDWPGPGVQVVSMVCTAGGVTWPGTLLFYHRGERVGELFLADLEPQAYRGGFEAQDATPDGDTLTVGYGFSHSNFEAFTEGSVQLTWDRATRTVTVTDHTPGRVPVETHPGGGLTIAGQGAMADADPWLRGRLGDPDRVEELTNCLTEGISGKRLTWGGLEVIILTESASHIPQALHSIPGAISGWRYDLDQENSRPRHQVLAAGHSLPVDAEELRVAFANGWDTQLISGPDGRSYFQVSVVGEPQVTFQLDGQGKARAAEAGVTCER